MSSNTNQTYQAPEQKFIEVAARPNNEKWEKAISRLNPMYKRQDDIRSEFERDYDRILHSNAFRRLKRKTQVFFATSNDHICTRIEHVNLVSSISNTIAKTLGLNRSLVSAIAMGHDLGHSPFGHHGEMILNDIVRRFNPENKFWHEGNSLRFVDKIETLIDYEGYEQNMNLSYGVRDGMVCHCGEIDENWIYPRSEFIDLETIKGSNGSHPFTFEGCVTKIADKISYLGRDIEDAISYRILDESQQKDLEKIIRKLFEGAKLTRLNHTVLTHKFTVNLCQNSTPEKGIGFSEEYFRVMNEIKSYNYLNICSHRRLHPFMRYAKTVLETLFEILMNYYRGEDTIDEMRKDKDFYPLLITHFQGWLERYSNLEPRNPMYKNSVIYDINSREDYIQAVIDFISGATDNFAIKLFNEIIHF